MFWHHYKADAIDHMREFVYVLKGDEPGLDYRARVAKFTVLSFKSALVLEYVLLVVGLGFFVGWAACHLISTR